MRYLSLVLLLSITLSSCKEPFQEEQALHKDLEFESVGYKYFEMDSLSHPNYMRGFIYDEGSKSYYTLNSAPKEHHIFYVFDEKTGKVKEKVLIPKEGPNGVARITGALVFSNGERPILSAYDEFLCYIYFFDWKKGVERIIKLPRSNDSVSYSSTFFPPRPRISSADGAYLLEGKIYTIGSSGGEFDNETEDNRPFTCKIDTTTGQIEYGLGYPKFYQKGNWGGVHLRDPSMAYISSKDEFIYSLPADSELYVQKRNSKEYRKVYAGSYKFEAPKPPIPLPKQDPATAEMKYQEMSLATTPFYINVIYDPYRRLIYRIAYFPYKNYEAGQDPFNYIKSTIVVLNENYEILGEVEFDKDKYDTSLIIAPEGLLIRTKAQEEDKLTYEIFKPRLAP